MNGHRSSAPRQPVSNLRSPADQPNGEVQRRAAGSVQRSGTVRRWDSSSRAVPGGRQPVRLERMLADSAIGSNMLACTTCAGSDKLADACPLQRSHHLPRAICWPAQPKPETKTGLMPATCSCNLHSRSRRSSRHTASRPSLPVAPANGEAERSSAVLRRAGLQVRLLSHGRSPVRWNGC